MKVAKIYMIVDKKICYSNYLLFLFLSQPCFPIQFKEVIQSYISLILGPEFARSVPVKPAFASSSILPILCLYTEEGFSMTEKLLPYLDNDETLTFISAFDDDLESDICRLMSGRHTVIIDHVSMPEKWVEKFTRILKVCIKMSLRSIKLL